MSRKRVTVTMVRCDWCGQRRGDAHGESDGGNMGEERISVRIVKVKRLKCNHDICDRCWYDPGDMKHCPKCGPREIGHIGNAMEKNITNRDYCFKHGCLRQADGSCNGGCRPTITK